MFLEDRTNLIVSKFRRTSVEHSPVLLWFLPGLAPLSSHPGPGRSLPMLMRESYLTTKLLLATTVVKTRNGPIKDQPGFQPGTKILSFSRERV